MMLRGNLKQVRIEKNPARLRALESAAGENEPAAAMALALAGETAPSAPAPAEERPDEEVGFTIDIKSFLKPGEKTYTQRCRLFVGNLPTDITEEDFKRLFERYGEPSEVFINRDRGFGFIRLVSGGRAARALIAVLPAGCVVLSRPACSPCLRAACLAYGEPAQPVVVTGTEKARGESSSRRNGVGTELNWIGIRNWSFGLIGILMGHKGPPSRFLSISIHVIPLASTRPAYV